MLCPKCKAVPPDGALYCSQCGRKLTPGKKRRTKSRGNGTGCAYYDPIHRYWIAQAVIDYRMPEDKSKQLIPVKKTKAGFKRREDALAYCPTLKGSDKVRNDQTLQEIYTLWEPWYSARVEPGTMAGYRAAYNYFSAIKDNPIRSITADALQQCMDACPKGKRTHQNMKVVAGLIWKYAKDKHIVTQIESDNLYTGKGTSKKREALTDIEVEKIRQAIGDHRYADYIYCLCYLGFRPGEMLELRKDQVTEHEGRLFITEGKKTEAGRNRTVPVHQKIEGIIRSRLWVPGTDLLFPQYVFARPSKKRPNAPLTAFKQMSDNFFREAAFKPLMNVLSIAEGKVPYGARHTFSNKLKSASGADIDKARLIGHSDYTFTQTHYQTTDIDELQAVMDSIK